MNDKRYEGLEDRNRFINRSIRDAKRVVGLALLLSGAIGLVAYIVMTIRS
jgi:hypothetical protein